MARRVQQPDGSWKWEGVGDAPRTPFNPNTAPFERGSTNLDLHVWGKKIGTTARPVNQQAVADRFFKTTAEGRRARSQFGGILAQGSAGGLGYKFVGREIPHFREPNQIEMGDFGRETSVYTHSDYKIRYEFNPFEGARLSEMESETRMLYANSFFS